MSGLLKLVDDDDNIVDAIMLTEMVAEADQVGEGIPIRYTLKNIGGTRMRDIAVRLDGAGSEVVQLAVDDSGAPKPWAEAGQEIIFSGVVEEGETRSFWLRGHFEPEDSEGRYEFTLQVRAVSY